MKERADLVVRATYGDDENTADEIQAAIKKQIKKDILFFFNYFVWTLDPREETDKQEMPMLLYEYQQKFVLWFIALVMGTQGTIKRHNIVIPKSRDMGVSWLIAAINVWFLLFHRSSVCVGSRKEEECDVLGDIESLLEKHRFIIRRLPDFLIPEGMNLNNGGHLGHKLLRNPEGGQISGESANPNFGRGGRNLYTVLDEFAAWDHDEQAWTSCGGSTQVRVAIFTPKGPFNKAAKLCNPDPSTGRPEKIEEFRMHWSLHPIKAAGLRKDKDGKLTSPWYAEECANKAEDEIASELDISFTKSTKGLVFPDYTEFHHAIDLEPEPGRRIIRVWDPGVRAFYVLFMQVDRFRRVLALRELCLDDAMIHEVAQEVERITTEFYRGHDVVDCGDPAGAKRVNSGQIAPEYTVLAEDYGIDVDYTFIEEQNPKLRVKNRIMAIHNKLKEFVHHTKSPGLMVDSAKCPKLHKALSEQYRYRVNKMTKQVTEEIDESHPSEDAVDCLGYGTQYVFGLATTSSSIRRDVEVDTTETSWNQLRRGR